MAPLAWPRPVPHERLPYWLCQRLQNMDAEAQVHYESSFVGPHNSFLNLHFPTHTQHMVKPVPRLRAKPWPNNQERTSFDSYNQPVLNRREDDVPDFVVCKATGELHADRAFLIWELKRNDAKSAESALQTDRYEEWLRNYQDFVLHTTGASPMLWMALVEGDLVTIQQYEVISVSTPRLISTICGHILSDVIDFAIERMLATYP